MLEKILLHQFPREYYYARSEHGASLYFFVCMSQCSETRTISMEHFDEWNEGYIGEKQERSHRIRCSR